MSLAHPPSPPVLAEAAVLPEARRPGADPVELFVPPDGLTGRIRSMAAVVAHAPTLWRLASVAAGAYGQSRLDAARRLRMLRRRGYRYEEALSEGMLDPSLEGPELNGYASRHVALQAQRAVNPGTFTDLTTEKAIFYRYCAAVGLPTPRTLAIVHRTTAGWGLGDRVLATGDDLTRLLAEHPCDLVVKPSDGGQGVNVRVLRRRGDLLVDRDGERAPQDLWTELRGNPDHSCFVVQERIRNGPELAALVESEALNTIRLATFVPADGPVEVSQAVLRLGIGGGDTDNVGDGSGGNGWCPIDPGSGRLGPIHVARPDGAGFHRIPAVPATGAMLEGRLLPRWDEVLALAERATAHFLPNRSIGWDIALAEQGPTIVEANREWTPFPQRDLLWALARIANS